ncbi:uncharacterized protein N7515_001484 [Penicillium bovifimosum]|uniref:Uncharacterized protein n=1 Tax=Penicillium bovifimosum TaxID=126998 RepID=A0A9W9L8T7_9EURO|nr:uncharacterized protein N7515_001484 [Penicillium bovifimosum]KAJ5142697.1 hypothetical protein N7515_001484 [Penicillium bovifimosum]
MSTTQRDQPSPTKSRARQRIDGLRAIFRYRYERDILNDLLYTYKWAVEDGPEGDRLLEVALDIHSLKIQADKVKRAALTVAIEAKDMKYAFYKPGGAWFFHTYVPSACDQFSRQMARRLVAHLEDPELNPATCYYVSQELFLSSHNLPFFK